MTSNHKAVFAVFSVVACVVMFFSVDVRGQSTAAQREWEKTWLTVSKLALDDKVADAVGMVQKFLTRYPNVGDAHFMQGRLYEQWAGSDDTLTPAQRRHLESAVKHYERALDLLTDETARFVTLWALEKLHHDRLKQPAVAGKYARRMVDEHPKRAESHVLYAQRLRDRNDIAGAADAMRKGRALVPDMPAAGLMLLQQYLLEQVQSSPDLPRDTTRTLLQEAMAAADVMIADPKRQQGDYRVATFAKATALGLMAQRVEQDRQRRLELLAEAERFGSPIDEHVNFTPPAKKPVTPERAATLEWEALRRWNGRLLDEQRYADVAAVYKNFLVERPAYLPAHAELADVYTQWAGNTTDVTARRSHLEQAAVHLQQVADLTTDVQTRSMTLTRLKDLFGPSQLNRADREEAVTRAMIKRNPSDPDGYYALAAVLFRTTRAADAEAALRTARKAIRSTALARAEMARSAMHVVRSDAALSADAARRLFDEAGALVTEAEKLDKAIPEPLEARALWLSLNASRFEKDPARAKAMEDESRKILERSLALREKKR